MKHILEIYMPYCADVSVNRYLAQTKSGGRYVRPTAELWGRFLQNSIVWALAPTPGEFKTVPFQLDIGVFFPRRFSIRSGDPTNFDKFIRDRVAQALKVDDAGTSGKQTGTYGNGDNAKIVLTLTLNYKRKREWIHKIIRLD
jgi:hypothetical protein